MRRAGLRDQLGPFAPTHFETTWANHEAMRRYRPAVYAGRVVLMRAEVRRVFGPHTPDLGWGELARGGVHTESIPGSHASILQEPNVQILATRLAAHLARVRPT